MEQMSVLGNRVDEAFSKKDYSAALETTQTIASLYNRLSDEDRKQFAFLQEQIDYAMTAAYSRLGRTDEALAAFTRLLDNGYTNYNKAKNDPELTAVRENPAFQTLLERIQEYDLVSILQSVQAYRADVPRPEFTYQGQEAKGLRALREEFKLDSVTGSGDEISRIKNLMGWVNSTVQHDGSHRPDTAMNASALIVYYRQTGRAINCRMIAIILNECYLAMGFSSRLVSCLPKAGGGDSHAINCVYSETLGT